MATITILEKLIKERDLIIIPRRTYEEFINLQKAAKKRADEERNTDAAIKIYKKEKKEGKLIPWLGSIG